MKYTMNRHTYIILLLFFLALKIQAQNNTHSPFSMFGIGEIEIRDFGRTTAMGGVGIGHQSENFLNRRNPAGLTRIDTLRFIVDVSAALKFSEFFTASKSQRTNNFNFKSLAAGVRLTNGWTSSVGLKPVSSIGYNLKVIENNQDIFFSGSGGVNSFYWANAYELFRGFSIGVTTGYMFGNITHNQAAEAITERITNNVSNIHFDFGMQYSYWFENHTNVIVGGIYIPHSNFAIQRSKMVTSSMEIEQNQRLPDTKSYLPESYGAGFSVLRNKSVSEWVIAADYQFSNWSVNPLRQKVMTYTDSHLYSAGIQFTPNTRRPERLLQVMRFSLGACYYRSNLKVNGYQLEDYSLSLGVGLPFSAQFRTVSYVNIAATVGESGTGQRGGISERYILVSLNLSLIDRWFAPRQWD